jgi:hypothetical protein
LMMVVKGPVWSRCGVGVRVNNGGSGARLRVDVVLLLGLWG